MAGPSDTEKLVTAIELMTGSAWTQDQRSQVADLVRQYRFNQLSAAWDKIKGIVKDGTDTDLSNKIFVGKKP